MTGRFAVGAACLLGFATAAPAQFAGPPYQGGYGGGGTGYGGGYGGGFQGAAYGTNPYATNPYNRVNQPLSPYLNLLRGGNAGVNYFYGVRPGTVGGNSGGVGGAPFASGGGVRPPYFGPGQVAPFDEPLDPAAPPAGYVLPPAGHPVVFNNTLGYFPFGGAGGGRGMRPGLGGVGAGGPAAGGSSIPRSR